MWHKVMRTGGSQFKIGTRKYGAAVNHQRMGKRRDAQDVSESEKIRTNECGSRRVSTQEEQKRK